MNPAALHFSLPLPHFSSLKIFFLLSIVFMPYIEEIYLEKIGFLWAFSVSSINMAKIEQIGRIKEIGRGQFLVWQIKLITSLTLDTDELNTFFGHVYSWHKHTHTQLSCTHTYTHTHTHTHIYIYTLTHNFGQLISNFWHFISAMVFKYSDINVNYFFSFERFSHQH